MSQTVFWKIDQVLWITGATTGCLFFLLVSAVFSVPVSVVIAGIVTFALAVSLPAALPWITRRSATFDLFSPYVIFPLAYIIWFTLGSINFIDAPPELEGGPFDPIPSWMYGLYAWGLAGYFVGLYLGHTLPIRTPKSGRREMDLGKLRPIVHLMFAGTLVFWVATQLQFGLPILHPDTLGDVRLALHGPLFQIFITFCWTSFVFSPAYIWVRGGKQRSDWFWTIGVPLFHSMLLLSFGGRSFLTAPLITLIIAMHYLKRKAGWKLIVGGVATFCAFSLFGYYREGADAAQTFAVQIGLPAPVVPFMYVGLYIRYAVSALRYVCQIIPSQVPFQYGAITLMPLNALLPGHQETSATVLPKLLGIPYSGSGQPATLLAPLYADFGWTGVFVGMVLYGVLLSLTFRKVSKHLGMGSAIFYAYWLMNTILALFGNGFAFINIFLLPMFWLGLFFLARGSQPDRDAPAVQQV